MSAPITTVYGKPSCMQCKATTRELDRRGVPYSYIDITTDSEAFARVRELGYTQAPVVTVTLPDGLDHWSEFRLQKIIALAYLVGTGAAS